MNEDEFITPSPGDDTTDLAAHADDRAIERIGPYRILQCLGEGGMGVVYEAEQEQPVRRRVALKVIKLGMDTAQVVARFESERQALALMDHPAIARVYDAGATSEGRPYFAMECVKGEPITDYCDRNGLSIEERLDIFIQVCEGVQHAHQKGIIHRDIKPSNVLVRDQDGRRAPKIIDFGIAKATAQRLTDKTFHTEMGQLVGTPEYMSPEQAEMGLLDPDTRTDVYLLGMLLYEILVGDLPFDAGAIRRTGFNEFRRMILEDDPIKPSARFDGLGSEKADRARRRSASPQLVSRRIQGDLDWITMKALEKDRTRRYASASEMAADVRRHLKDEPVQAGPPSNVYKLHKFVRRHSTGVAFAAVLFVLLITFAASMVAMFNRVVHSKDQAEQQAAVALSVSDFLEGLFKVSDPTETKGDEITLRDILDKGARAIRDDLADQPEVQARLMRTIGAVYASLGLFEQAQPLLGDALVTQQAHLGDQDLEVARTMDTLGGLLARMGRFSEARSLYESAIDIRRRRLGENDPLVGSSKNNLAALLMQTGGRERAVELFAEASRIFEKSLGSEHPNTLASMNTRAVLLTEAGDYEAARPLFEQVLRVREGLRDDVYVARTLLSLANLLSVTGDHEGAMARARRALEINQRIFGPEHRDVATTLVALALLNARRGEIETAESLHDRGAEILTASAAMESPFVLYNEARYAALLGRTEQALDHLRGSVVEHKFWDETSLVRDPDFAGLRENPDFREIVRIVATRNVER